MKISKRFILFLGAVVLFVLFIYVYTYISPETAVWMPKCQLKTLTGLQCPGCGTQRALHAVLNGDIWAAVAYNPLLVLSVPYALLVLLTLLPQFNSSFPKLRNILLAQKSIWVLLVVLLVYTIVRNVVGF